MRALLLGCLTVSLVSATTLLAKSNSSDESKREYFPVTVCKMKTNDHTHVTVTGRVALVKREGDGDRHIRIEDGGCFIVAECIPELPCTEPKVGERITVEGISRTDGEHKWPEVHPVEHLKIQN